MVRWISGRCGIYPKAWPTKNALRAELPDHTARRIDFGIHGYGWCAFYPGAHDRVVAKDGTTFRVYECHLYNGHIMSFRDLTNLDGTPFERGWKDSLHRTIQEELNIA